MASGPASEASPPPPLTGASLIIAGFILALSNFTVVLDMSIANVSVPHIAGGLAVSPTQGTWVITSYAVAEAITVPLSGWLSQRFGMIRCYVLAVLGFGLFSALCGLAVSLPMLVVCRILQGLAGGPLMPLSQTLLMQIFPREKRASALSLWAMTTVLGPVAGPILGGTISDNWSWHWIFLINVPITIICGTLTWRLMKARESKITRLPIDYVGLILLIIWVGALQLMLDKGRELDWFGSAFIVILAIVAAIGFAAFLIWELTDANPIVNLRIFRNRGFAAGVAAQCTTFGAYFASIVLVPLWLQTNLDYTATYAGYAMAFTGMAALVASPIAGKLITRFDPRMVVSVGIFWVGCMAFLRTNWFTGIDFWTAALPQLLQGFGMPLFFIGVTAIALSTVPPSETASAAGVMNFMRTLGAAIATAAATTFWEHSQQSSHAELSGILNGGDATVATLQRSGMSLEQARATIDQIVTTESLTLATTHVFMVTGVIFFLAASVVWLAPKPRKAVDTSAAH